MDFVSKSVSTHYPHHHHSTWTAEIRRSWSLFQKEPEALKDTCPEEVGLAEWTWSRVWIMSAYSAVTHRGSDSWIVLILHLRKNKARLLCLSKGNSLLLYNKIGPYSPLWYFHKKQYFKSLNYIIIYCEKIRMLFL